MLYHNALQDISLHCLKVAIKLVIVLQQQFVILLPCEVLHIMQLGTSLINLLRLQRFKHLENKIILIM